MPFLRNDLLYYPMPAAMSRHREERAKYDASRVPVLLAEDLYANSVFHAVNAEVGYSLLRVLGPGERPSFRDIAILRTLPNDLPTFAGAISPVPRWQAVEGATGATFTPSADLAGYAARAVIRYADGSSGPDEPAEPAASASTDAIP